MVVFQLLVGNQRILERDTFLVIKSVSYPAFNLLAIHQAIIHVAMKWMLISVERRLSFEAKSSGYLGSGFS